MICKTAAASCRLIKQLLNKINNLHHYFDANIDN